VLLARIGLATQDDELAQLALLNSRPSIRAQPGVSLGSRQAAAHVRGLLEPGHASLREAVDLFGAHSATARAGGRNAKTWASS